MIRRGQGPRLTRLELGVDGGDGSVDALNVEAVDLQDAVVDAQVAIVGHRA